MFAPPATRVVARTAAPDINRQSPGRSAYGNQANLRRLPHARVALPPGPIPQAKLTIGPADDLLEREADRVATEVTAMPDPNLSITSGPPRISRACAACESDEAGTVRTKPAGVAHEVNQAPPAVDAVLRTQGQPLDTATRDFFEPRFGHDLSALSVHVDAPAGQSAAAIGARAYTVGRHMVFRSGDYVPQTARGRQLLAHEIAHTIQQEAGAPIARRAPDPATPATPEGAATATTTAPAHDNWVMLGLPPVVKQAPASLTCWAAAPSSWTGARCGPCAGGLRQRLRQEEHAELGICQRHGSLDRDLLQQAHR